MAPLLKEKSFVTPSTVDHVMLKDEVPSQKNYRILHDVLPCLMNGKSLSEFCQILKSSDRLKEIGEEIMGKLEFQVVSNVVSRYVCVNCFHCHVILFG